MANDAIAPAEMPRIRDLYRRHGGLTPPLSHAYEEAAAICLADKIRPTVFRLTTDGGISVRVLLCRKPTIRQARAWANRSDAIAAAAYGVSLSAVEAEYGLVAVARASTLSGADYYVAPAGDCDYLEDAIRLEVSGTDSAEVRRVNERIRRKVEQVARDEDPALVSVLSFEACKIIIRKA